MEIWDQIREGAKTVADKASEAAKVAADRAKELAETTRIKSEITNLTRSKSDKIKQIGDLIYEYYSGGELKISNEVRTLCEEIKGLDDQIAAKEEKMGEVKRKYRAEEDITVTGEETVEETSEETVEEGKEEND